MKNLALVIILWIFFCSTIFPTYGQKPESTDAAIEIAIADFIKCKLSKEFNAFTVSIDEISEYAPYKMNDEITTISIFPAFLRVHITPLDTIGSTRLPTRYIIKDGKLFYWHDFDYGLTEEMIKVLYQFNVADSIDISDPSITVDDYTYNYIHHQVNRNTKAADYYLCKKAPSNYKRIITSVGIGGYEPPKVRCRH